MPHPESKETEARQLREEFNRWAEAGRGEHMEADHLPIVLPALELMRLEPTDRVLDVGCGTGWLPRLIAARVPQGSVVGLDVSDEMIARARTQSAAIKNAAFQVGAVDHLPAEAASFTKVISVESAYYWPDPASGLHEIFRVLAPGGSAWILINYYRDNPHCHQWGAQYAIPAHLLAADEWARLFRDAGFTEVAHRRIPDNSPTPEVYSGRWFRDAEQLRKFKQEGALLVCGLKPRF
ncbi:MAG: methyltransferase domain-containing protein [Terriglobia bacterium]|jgi:ubiquinone/menaquinone biosynthesis C-methylase UbiE